MKGGYQPFTNHNLMELKGTLMLHAVWRDYFGYGSDVKKTKSGQYKIIVDGMVNYYSLSGLAKEFDILSDDLKKDIINDFYECYLEGEK